MKNTFLTFFFSAVLLACGAKTPSPQAPAPESADAKNEAKATGGEASADPTPSYPATSEANLGTVNGKPALFKHAFITTGEGFNQLQAFTLDDVKADEVCPNGLRFVSEGTMLQVRFGSATEVKDPKEVLVQTDKPNVDVKKALAKLPAGIKPGTKVKVDVDVDGSNKTKLKGSIEAVVCFPPKA